MPKPLGFTGFGVEAMTADPKAYSSTYFMPNDHDKQISHLRQWIFHQAGGGVKWGRYASREGEGKGVAFLLLRSIASFTHLHTHLQTHTHTHTHTHNISRHLHS